MVHDYPPLTGGGLALGALELASCLQPDLRCRVVSSRLTDHFADDRAARRGSRQPGVAWAPALSPDAVRWLREADVLLVHWTFSFRRLSTAAIVVGPLLGIRTVCVIHTAPEHCDHNRIRGLPRPVRPLLLASLRLALRGCVGVVALSSTHADALQRAGITAGRVLPLPVAVLPQRLPQDRRGASRLGFAGELSSLKGADVLPGLIHALTPQFAFRIAGSGPLERCLPAGPLAVRIAMSGRPGGRPRRPRRAPEAADRARPHPRRADALRAQAREFAEAAFADSRAARRCFLADLMHDLRPDANTHPGGRDCVRLP